MLLLDSNRKLYIQLYPDISSQVGLELNMQPKMTPNSWQSSCLSLQVLGLQGRTKRPGCSPPQGMIFCWLCLLDLLSLYHVLFSVCTCALACACMCGDKVSLGVSSLSVLYLISQVFSLNLQLAILTRLSGQPGPGIHLSVSQCCGYRYVQLHLAFSTSDEDLNSGPHACQGSTLHTEPYFQFLYLNKILSFLRLYLHHFSFPFLLPNSFTPLWSLSNS